MLFKNKETDKTVIDMLVEENKKLKNQNSLMRKQLDSISDCKNKYEELIKNLEEMQKQYIRKLDEFNKLEISFRKELEEKRNL